MYPYQCASCLEWFEGAAYHLPGAKQFSVYRGWFYEGPEFCSEACRSKYEEGS